MSELQEAAMKAADDILNASVLQPDFWEKRIAAAEFIRRLCVQLAELEAENARLRNSLDALSVEREVREPYCKQIEAENSRLREGAARLDSDAHPYGEGQRPMGWDPQAHE